MPSSPLPVPNSPTLSADQSPDVPVLAPSTGVPMTSLPTTSPTTVTGVKEVDPDAKVPPAAISSAQIAEPSDGASAAIVTVPEPALVETLRPKTNPDVLALTESIPVVTSAAVDLTDGQDDVAPQTAIEKPADGSRDISNHSMGM